MRTEINNVSSIVLQEQLDTQFGAGVFTVVVDKDAYKFYLEYVDDTDLALALDMATKESIRKFTETLNRLYDQTDRMSKKTIMRYKPQPPDASLVNSATSWLTDTTQPCPDEITTTSILKGIDAQTLAEQIVAADSSYKSFLVDVATMRDQTLAQLLTATTIPQCKAIATIAFNYFNDLEKNFQS